MVKQEVVVVVKKEVEGKHQKDKRWKEEQQQ
jgi:hypothetical protein